MSDAAIGRRVEHISDRPRAYKFRREKPNFSRSEMHCVRYSNIFYFTLIVFDINFVDENVLLFQLAPFSDFSF